MKVNYTLQQSVKYQILNESQCAEIAGAAYRILARTGCIVQNQKALALLKRPDAWWMGITYGSQKR